MYPPTNISEQTADPSLLFQERQRFTQWWLWLILISILIPVFYELWNNINSGASFNLAAFLWSGGLVLLIILLFLFMRLDTEIKGDGVYVRFFPFASKLKVYEWEDIDKAYVRKYRPLIEYGGWGVRYGARGKALNVSGNQGLQLELKNGKKLLIGTRKPEELNAVLLQLGKGEESSAF